MAADQNAAKSKRRDVSGVNDLGTLRGRAKRHRGADIAQANTNDSDARWVCEPAALTAVVNTQPAIDSVRPPRLPTPPNVRVEPTNTTVEYYEIESGNGSPHY